MAKNPEMNETGYPHGVWYPKTEVTVNNQTVEMTPEQFLQTEQGENTLELMPVPEEKKEEGGGRELLFDVTSLTEGSTSKERTYALTDAEMEIVDKINSRQLEIEVEIYYSFYGLICTVRMDSRIAIYGANDSCWMSTFDPLASQQISIGFREAMKDIVVIANSYTPTGFKVYRVN